jgi:hypothetical protein
MTGYCALADVQAFLPAGGLPNSARVATSNYTLSNALECQGHGLALNAAVVLRAEAGGSLPAPLTAGATYYAIPIDEAHFALSATSSGGPITLTADGANFVFTSPLPFDAWMEWGARQVDSFLPMHVIPLTATPYPEIVVTANAELAAYRGLQATGGSDIDLGARIDAVGARLTRWAKTIPIRGTTVQVQQPSNLALTKSCGAYDPRGWSGCDDRRLP